jgi:hypothetical protein
MATVELHHDSQLWAGTSQQSMLLENSSATVRQVLLPLHGAVATVVVEKDEIMGTLRNTLRLYHCQEGASPVCYVP